MTITIINDCRDENAKARQVARAASIFKCAVAFVGVANDLEASGNLVDALDALEDRRGVVLVNVAPRHGKAKQWPNGTPFGYFRYKGVLVAASIDGCTLSLAKKLNLIDAFQILDTEKTTRALEKRSVIQKETGHHVVRSQFRSFNFLPKAAAVLLGRRHLPSRAMDLETIPDAPRAIWWVDNFGNCKTTLLADELPLKETAAISEKIGALQRFPRLKDVPDDTAALIEGSSGIGPKRFLEIVVQGGSAAGRFNLRSGSLL